MKKGMLLLSLFVCVVSSFTNQAAAQKITGKYWIYSNVSSMKGEGTEYLAQVDDSFQGTKIFFDADGEFEIYFADKKSFTYSYEWDSKSQDLIILFVGDGSDNQHIQLLQYYEYRCSLMGEGTLKLDFYAPDGPDKSGYDVNPEFSMFFKVK